MKSEDGVRISIQRIFGLGANEKVFSYFLLYVLKHYDTQHQSADITDSDATRNIIVYFPKSDDERVVYVFVLLKISDKIDVLPRS